MLLWILILIPQLDSLNPGQKIVKLHTSALFTLIFLLLGQSTLGSSSAKGQVIKYESPNKIIEHCVMLNHMPGGDYSSVDEKTEAEYCAIDLYASSTAICPKTWSTSPGTIIFDISAGKYAHKPEQFEQHICAKSKHAKSYSVGDSVNFKSTMNERDTSGTFSTASLLYYHFSRYFQTHIQVPVAVQRSIDKDMHRKRVTHRGIQLTSAKGGTQMIHAAWKDMDQVEKNPDSYKPTDELFTADRKQIYGVLLRSVGKRYSALINGTRKSGWGEGQNRDFQHTPPFLALRSNKPLTQAIAEGLSKARKDHTMARAMKKRFSDEQMAYWMQDLTEITLLDYIFSQQDRIGNIDYLTYWYWLENGELRSKLASTSAPNEAIAGFNPVRLMRTQLNDNDAGGRPQYANFTKRTGMLNGLHHYNPETYRKLIRLNRDFQAKGALYEYVRDTFGLTARQFKHIVDNTGQAAKIIQSACESGALRFDLNPDDFLRTGKSEAVDMDCSA